MHINTGVLNLVFIITSIILISTIVIQKLFMAKLKNTGFIAIIAIFLALYIIEAFLIAIFTEGFLYKAIMLLFALSPFIIGKIVKYETENIFSLIQILCISLSAALLYIH